ncbi:hypothetical protein CSQ89_06820 [Chitinimonas sp. BJB300]|nr:hypothetical protein CSQ89_06820 [Chitinimonas sp. BJB300]
MVVTVCFELGRLLAFFVSFYGLDGEVGRGLIGYIWFLVGYLEDVRLAYGKYRLYFMPIMRGTNNWRKLMLLLLIISTSINGIVLAKHSN